MRLRVQVRWVREERGCGGLRGCVVWWVGGERGGLVGRRWFRDP